jgi:phage baseplate assembly protein W
VISRADTFTNVKKKQEYFSDFFDNFDKTPMGNEVARAVNEKSVNQSIRNLILTNFGDRLFQPNAGCNITGSLFELSGIVFENMLRDSIVSTIGTYERDRVVLESVIVSQSNDSQSTYIIDKNSVEVTIVYYLINNAVPITLTVFLRRIR